MQNKKRESKNNEPENKKIKLQQRVLFDQKKKASHVANDKSKPTISYKLSLTNYVTNSDNNDHSYCKTD